MTSPAIRALPMLLFLTLVSLTSGCHPAADGPKVFLQAEEALDKVQRFQMHIDLKTALPTVTEAKFDCEKNVTWYQTTQTFTNAPVRSNEFVQTESFQFTRELAPEQTAWSKGRKQIGPYVCDRLKTPSVQGVPSNRLITADQAKAVPPFYTYANEQGATITHDGDELVDDVNCEIWTIHHSASLDAPHSIWIAASDRLPRKYIEGERDKPVTVVTYTAYGVPLDIQLPPG